MLPGDASANTRAAELIAAAERLVNLRTAATVPFHLKMDVRLMALPHNSAASGTYTLDFAAPDRFREQLAFPGFSECNVISGNKLWRTRSPNYRPLRLWQFVWLTDIPARIRFPVQEASELSLSEEQGGKMVCVTRSEPRERHCFDSQGRPFIVESGPLGATELYHYLDYQPFASAASPAAGIASSTAAASVGPQNSVQAAPIESAPIGPANSSAQIFFPRTMRYSFNSVIEVEAKVSELTSLQSSSASLDPSLFAKPLGAIERDWCADPKPAVPVKPLHRTYNAEHPGVVMLDTLVGADGRVRDVYVLESMDAATDAQARGYVRGMRFTPAMCGGTAVEDEFVVPVHFIERERIPGRL